MQLVKNNPALMQPESSYTCWKTPAIGPYSDPLKFSPVSQTTSLTGNIILPSKCRSLKWCLSFRISAKNSVCVTSLGVDLFTLYLNLIHSEYILIYHEFFYKVGDRFRLCIKGALCQYCEVVSACARLLGLILFDENTILLKYDIV
jgi:hypothetical protein